MTAYEPISRSILATLTTRRSGARVKGLTRGLIDGAAPGKGLSSAHDNINISGVELDTVADAAGHLGGDQARTGAEKRVINHLTQPAVVGDRATHAFDRLLGAVPPGLLVPRVSERVVVGDFPDRCLCAVALPMTGLALAHRIPAGFVFPVVIAAAQREMLLGPNDLSATLKPAGR